MNLSKKVCLFTFKKISITDKIASKLKIHNIFTDLRSLKLLVKLIIKLVEQPGEKGDTFILEKVATQPKTSLIRPSLISSNFFKKCYMWFKNCSSNSLTKINIHKREFV